MTDHSELEAAVKEAEKNLNEARAKAAFKPYPTWIVPHESHVENVNGHISTPEFEHHIDREGKVTVLVHDEEAEKKATSVREMPKEEVHQEVK